MDNTVWIPNWIYMYLSLPIVTSRTVMNFERIEMQDATDSRRMYCTVASIVDGSLAIQMHNGLARAMINTESTRYDPPEMRRPTLVLFSSSSFEPSDLPRMKKSGRMKASSMIS